MTMRALGKPNVHVGDASVPTGAFGTWLKTLIGQAAGVDYRTTVDALAPKRRVSCVLAG